MSEAPQSAPSPIDDARSSTDIPAAVAGIDRVRGRVSRPSAISMLAGTVVGLIAWLATGPRWVAFVNWDSGVYLWDLARGGPRWTGGGWSSHFAMSQLYVIATWIALLFGGTAMQGFRLLGAVAFGLTASFLTLAAQRARLSRWWTALVVALWLLCYPTVLDLMTIEDNAAFLPTAAALFWIVSERLDHWGIGESLAAGAFAAMSMLVSWQAVLYLAPALYVAAILGRPERRLAERCLHTVLTSVGFLASLVAWIAFQAATTTSTFSALWGSFFARPQPSLFPSDRAGILALLGNVSGMASTLGIASYRILLPGFSLPSLAARTILGFTTLTVLLGLFAHSVWRWRKHDDRRTHFFAGALCFFTVTTAYYQIAEQDNIKRFDFIPLTVAFLVIAYVQAAKTGLVRRLVPILLLIVLVGEAAGSVHWWRATMATPATAHSNWVLGEHPAPAIVAGTQQSWYRRIDSIKRSKPGACRYVFDIKEIQPGRWWSEIPALLWSEMHDTHRVLAEPPEQRGWKRPAHFVTVAEISSDNSVNCAWFSDVATARLKRAGISPNPK